MAAAITTAARPKVLTWERPKLYQKQFDAFFNEKRYSFCEASTKAGKTVGGMTWLTEMSLRGSEGQNRWWVAPVVNQAKIAYSRIKRGLPPDLIRTWETDSIIELPNKSLMRFLSGEDPDNLYGEDVFDAVIDEASRVREEAYHAVRSTLTATRGKLRAIGNVKGRMCWFYRMARRAEFGDPDMFYSKITAKDAIEAGIISADEVEDARRNLPAEVFKELYEAEPTDGGGNPFGMTAIGECVSPLSSAPPVCYGVDLAKSVDWTVIIGLDAAGRTCRFERFQMPWNDTVRKTIQVCGDVPTLVDSTGVGDPVLEQLQKEHPNFEGLKFTSNSKQQLMEGLAVAIQNKSVFYPQGVIVSELNLYEYEYTRTGVKYTAPEGFHDDCVCALALAVRRKTIPVVGEGGFDWYKTQWQDMKAKEKTRNVA